MKKHCNLFIIMAVCLLGACKNDDKACATKADELNAKEQALNQREEQLNAREKQMTSGSMTTTTTTTTDSSTMSSTAAAKEPSMFRKNRSRTGYPHSNTSGQFPEGTDRVLTDKDLEYLSPWGVKVITNEIYARHGKTFTDQELKKHFDEEKWYHARAGNVDRSLTKTEKQNLSFISNFKAQE